MHKIYSQLKGFKIYSFAGFGIGNISDLGMDYNYNFDYGYGDSFDESNDVQQNVFCNEIKYLEVMIFTEKFEQNIFLDKAMFD